MPNYQLSRVLWPRNSIHFPACTSGASAAPQTFTLTPASFFSF